MVPVRTRPRGLRGTPWAAAALVAALLAPAAAAAPAPPAPRVRVVVGDQTLTLDPAPVVIDGVPYVPAPAFAKALGIPVAWDPHAATLTVAGAAGSAHSFVFQGIRYAVTGLEARTYPGPGPTSGAYWIVQYSLTNVTRQAIDVPTTEPTLVLLGPGGAEYQADPTNSGPAPGVLNPGITFSSYDVFDVPAGAAPGAYALGFDAYRSTPHGFQPAPLGAALPPSTAQTTTTSLDATYTVTDLWNGDVQEVLLKRLVRTTALLPDLTPGSFNPTTSVWIVDLAVNNPGTTAITLAPSEFALTFADGATIAPYPVGPLPGWVPASSLYAVSSTAGPTTPPTPASVTVAPGTVWQGALLFEVPGTVATSGPALAITVNGAQRVLPLAPCPGGACPPPAA
jgi:hypothetical protein